MLLAASFCWLAGAYALSCDHIDQQKKPILIRDHKIKWPLVQPLMRATFPLILDLCG